jgi:hypothetical protein
MLPGYRGRYSGYVASRTFDGIWGPVERNGPGQRRRMRRGLHGREIDGSQQAPRPVVDSDDRSWTVLMVGKARQPRHLRARRGGLVSLHFAGEVFLERFDALPRVNPVTRHST